MPDWDDPDELQWSLLPFAFFRRGASVMLGYDPVTEKPVEGETDEKPPTRRED